MGSPGEKTCSLAAVLVFLFALIAGTFCSLTSKVMLGMKSIDMGGNEANFENPLFQTFGMFLGMNAALVGHFAVKAFQIPFPGYAHDNGKGEFIDFMGATVAKPKDTPSWMYYILIFPSIFDLIATSLCMFGLLHVNVSIYQMLRGSAIIFVALLKQFVLGDKLKKFMWVGIFWNVVSIILVGATAMFSAQDEPAAQEEAGTAQKDPLWGVTLILAGAFVQSLQYAFEEKVMTMGETKDDHQAVGNGEEDADAGVSAPPLLLIGMEGLWGSLICVFILYPVAYYSPGPDYGCVENPYNTMAMIRNSTEVQQMFILYFFSILSYNILACLVTFMMDSVWHAILDNFRPISVWGTDLFIFYLIAPAFGEEWTMWSWLQLAGMGVLLYGTAVYNAPNAGSIKLTGGIYDCMIDCSDEYEELEAEAEAIDHFESGPSMIHRGTGSFGGLVHRGSFHAGAHFNTMSPFMGSPATTARRQAERAVAHQEQQSSRGVQMQETSRLGGGRTNYGSDR